MGAQSFIHEVKARTAREAFDKLIAEANTNCGTEPYNGSINTCDMGGCSLSFKEFNKTNLNAAYKHIKDRDNGEKWSAEYVDVGVTEYVVTTVKKENTKGEKPVYKMQFCVYEHSFARVDVYTGHHFDTKTEADNKAMELALKDNKEYRVKKEYTNTNGKANGVVTEIVLESKTYKSKPTLKPMPNRKIEAIKTFVFYGWASC